MFMALTCQSLPKVRKFAEDVLGKYKSVDVLVNNAGMGPSSGGGPVKGKGAIVQYLPSNFALLRK